MKPQSCLFALATVAAALTSGPAMADDDPSDAARRALGNRINNTGAGSGASIVAPKTPARQVTTINYTAVSPKRQWTDSKGRQLIAHLLAFAAPKEGETGPVVVINNGKVRLLLDVKNRRPVDFPLDQLSEEDQEFVNQIAEAAKKGPPQPAAKGPAKPEKAPYKPLSGPDKPEPKAN